MLCYLTIETPQYIRHSVKIENFKKFLLDNAFKILHNSFSPRDNIKRTLFHFINKLNIIVPVIFDIIIRFNKVIHTLCIINFIIQES